tara:strand:+ start:2064 stop:3206 length:1143 start_codon:yes stop_codon:yes gene_type:complete
MIDPQKFLDHLLINKITSFYGVPDSLLKELCKRFLSLPSTMHQISSNEGMGICSAIGHHLATGNMACVYLQNSGLGNTINPLVSLASKDVYSIPILLIIGWRGEISLDGEQLKDEPQHVQQGKVTLKQLEILNIPYKIISSQSKKWEEEVSEIIEVAKKGNKPVALICRKNTFEKVDVINSNSYEKDLMSREDAIKLISNIIPNHIPLFSTTGMASRELYEIRKSNNEMPIDFYTVGGMGFVSSIATGYLRGAKNCKKAVCIDGDGSVLMHMGSMFKVAKQKGIIHIVLNNNAHDSVGGQPTNAFDINFKKLGDSLGFDFCYSFHNKDEIKNLLEKAINDFDNSYFIEIKIKTGNRDNLGRPKEKPSENKELFMKKWSNL